jgi:hypothetical protein
LNDTLNNSFEANFNTIVKMSKKKYDYQELIDLLSSDEIAEKQIAVLQLNEIKSKKDALILASKLVNQDGKIREAAAFKIDELAQNPDYTDFFMDEKIFDIFLLGIMDINGNVCRYVINLCKLKQFQEYLCEKLPESIIKILAEIKKLNKNEKQYKISKRNFQLYWCLEALYNIIENIKPEKITEILLITGEFSDYTIREKTAKILTKVNNQDLYELKEKLKNDENYYVRKELNQSKSIKMV